MGLCPGASLQMCLEFGDGSGDAIVKGPIDSVVWSVCCRCLQIFVGNLLPCCDGKCGIVAILIRFSCEDLTEVGDEGCE